MIPSPRRVSKPEPQAIYIEIYKRTFLIKNLCKTDKDVCFKRKNEQL